jgi:hypothetical protein
MQNKSTEKPLKLGMPATYRIHVQGYLDNSRSDWLGGMGISKDSLSGQAPVTTLVGRLRDQASLIGVLNSLYELRLPILSVEYQKE